jgi:D-alanyl-D-alanine carboxypeptidase/D-alanyl-D-alanine-endopeptidase (penicillin-binding protein 4)
MDITALAIGIALTSATLWQPCKPLSAPSAHLAQQAGIVGDKSNILPTDIATILERPELRSATIGLYAINLKTGSPVIKYNSTRACMPASNQKLLTAAAGLQLLGPDFTWKTDISQNGTTLHITFDGDPLLTRAQITAAINGIKTSITEPITRIAIDDSRIQGDPLGLAWQWDDIGLGFSAPVGAATIDKNVVKVTVTPPATVTGTQRFEIADGILSIRANVSIEEANPANAAAPDIKNRLTITRNPLRPEVEISGILTAGAKPITSLVAVDNPTDAAFRIINGILRETGIPVAANIQYTRRLRQADDTLLTRITSKPLAQTLPDFLKPSDNLYGELLLRTIGRIDASPATPASGIKRIQTWMTERNIPTDGVQPADGSGLSMWNTTTAEATVALLKELSDTKAFRDALPVGGIDGTLKARFPAPEHRGKVIAKTGTLSVASCLSGYAVTTKGETVIFSILMNHFDRKAGSAAARRAQDDIVRYLLSL